MIKKKAERTIEIKENMRGGRGPITIEHIFMQDEIKAKSRLCAKMIIPPGASIGLHQHENEDELYLITAGTGLLDNGQTIIDVTAGDSVLTGNGESHAISNNSNVNLEIIAVIMLY